MAYDPSKQYKWKQDDEIVFTGKEFMILNQALTTFISAGIHDIPMILKLTEAFGVIQMKMNQYVDKGVIVENVEAAPVGQSE